MQQESSQTGGAGRTFLQTLSAQELPFSADDLFEIMAYLSGPNGCPWDGRQDHRSLIPYFLEETYEAVSAIEADDPAHLCEELGDVWMQIAFHTVLAERAGRFSRQDVLDGICAKMIRRHPHVFGDAVERDDQALNRQWERQKKLERSGTADADRHPLELVPAAMPALMRAVKLQKRAQPELAHSRPAVLGDPAAGAAAVPPDEPDLRLTALAAETDPAALAGSLIHALAQLAQLNDRQTAREPERPQPAHEAETLLGALLFGAARLCGLLNIQPEAALLQANRQFVRTVLKTDPPIDTIQDERSEARAQEPERKRPEHPGREAPDHKETEHYETG